MNFIKKIFDSPEEEVKDRSVHLHFQKFSRGEFKERAIIEARKSVGKGTISTSSEFANELVRIAAEDLGEKKVSVTGAIISTSNIKDKINFKEIKQFQGVKRYLIDSEMSGTEIVSLLEKIPKAFFALSFSSGEDFKLKIKPKAPKSGKPSTKGEEKPKADFCKFVTKEEEVIKEFVFEVPDFKKASISHTFFIDEIIIPNELKKTNDFAKIREEAKRKGKIVRVANIDGREIKSEKSFCV